VIRLVNERAERLFGYARRELLGQPSTLVLPDDVRAARDVQRKRSTAAAATAAASSPRSAEPARHGQRPPSSPPSSAT